MVVGMTIMISVAVGFAIAFSFFLRTINKPEEDGEVSYDSHYMYIVDDSDGDFWKQVYESASEQAKADGIYLENIKDSLGSGYSNEDLLRVAINSAVDGILYAGAPTDEAALLIDEAVDRGICVCTLQNDIDKSKRQSFVGISNYELGQMYASQIPEMVEADDLKKTSIAILASSDMAEGATNLISLAIEEYLTDSFPDEKLPDIRTIRIDAEDTFSVEEEIRKIFRNEENVPEIAICLEEIYTQCIYQDIVDFNYVGECQVVGYSANDEILDAIDKGIVHSTVSIDTQEMGKMAVNAIEEYNATGYTNSFMPVKMEIVNKAKAANMIVLENASKEEEE